MKTLVLVPLLVASMVPGCANIFGGCGPTVLAYEWDGHISGMDSSTNRSLAGNALVAAGFQAHPNWQAWEHGNITVEVGRAGENGVHISLDVPSHEFPDSDRGWEQAHAIPDWVRGTTDAVVQEISHATGGKVVDGKVEPAIAIC